MPSNLKGSQSNENLKQKSLMSFFSKPQAATSSGNSSSVKRRVADLSSDPADHPESSPLFKTPKTRVVSSAAVKSANFSRSSDGGDSAKDTPPTSDAIDVDMLSEEEEEIRPKNVSDLIHSNQTTIDHFQTRIKRKIVVEDSDEEEARPAKKKPVTKKQRLSEHPSDRDDQASGEDDNAPVNSFTQKLSQFKKPTKIKTNCASFSLLCNCD